MEASREVEESATFNGVDVDDIAAAGRVGAPRVLHFYPPDYQTVPGQFLPATSGFRERSPKNEGCEPGQNIAYRKR